MIRSMRQFGTFRRFKGTVQIHDRSIVDPWGIKWLLEKILGHIRRLIIAYRIRPSGDNVRRHQANETQRIRLLLINTQFGDSEFIDFLHIEIHIGNEFQIGVKRRFTKLGERVEVFEVRSQVLGNLVPVLQNKAVPFSEIEDQVSILILILDRFVVVPTNGLQRHHLLLGEAFLAANHQLPGLSRLPPDQLDNGRPTRSRSRSISRRRGLIRRFQIRAIRFRQILVADESNRRSIRKSHHQILTLDRLLELPGKLH